MSRTGNCLDNSLMGNFLEKWKWIFHGHEYKFKSLDQLEKAMVKYIEYYNKNRISFNHSNLLLECYDIYAVSFDCVVAKNKDKRKSIKILFLKVNTFMS